MFALGTLGCVAIENESVKLLAAEISKTDDTDASITAEPAASPAPAATTPDTGTGDESMAPATETQLTGTMPTLEEEEPPLPAKPAAVPFQEPPLPTESGTGQPVAETPAAENPLLQPEFSDWDLSQVQSPTFLSAAINEFNERPLQLTGNWSLKPHLSTGTYYDGNIFLRSTNNQSDIVTRVSPGLTMRLGNTDSIFYMAADYTLGLNYYLEHLSESTVDQDGNVQFQWSMPKTTIGLNLSVSSDTGQDVDVTDRVRRELYNAGLTTHYAFGEKTSWDFGVNYTRSDFNGLISSSEYDADVFLNYQYSPKTQVGLGVNTGYMEVPGSSGQVYEGLNLRATYRATGKLTLISEVGAQLRQFESGIGTTLTPVFTLGGAWAVKQGTEVDVTAHRSIYASAILNDQNYTATSLDLTVHQRITDYVDVGLGVGYVNTAYSATATGVSAVREDNYFYIRPTVEWKALSWLSVGIFYEYSQDVSQGGQANSFTRDRGGVDVAFLF